MNAHLRRLPCLLLAALLGGCSTGVRDGGPHHPVDVSRIPDAVPRPEPRSRYGNPPSYVVAGRRYYVMRSSRGYVARGIASWYGTKFHGRRTASGEPYDMYKMTAAHRTLPIPTYVRVTNLENGRSVVVRVNDRGPFHANRLIDLSWAAAAKLGMLGKGTALVEVRALDPTRPTPHRDTTVRPHAAHVPRLYLQVGAFVSRANAERLLEHLDVAHAFIAPGLSHQQRVYRVRIGPLPSVEAADALARRLEARGLRDAHVVID
ncbi:MAG: septal ring lytic transglycosylase RlpA family protein [Gammaproteobacteria bacterium]|nr:MAG: septal ring lytic transglycosylase RlpA family protein [Gammaproteobacteria bacterium]